MLTVFYLLQSVALIPDGAPFYWPVANGTAYRIVDANKQTIGMLVEPVGCSVEVDNPPTDPNSWHVYTDHALVWRGGQSDVNADGYLNGIDADLFNEWFVAGSVFADFDCNEFINGDDHDAFTAAFASGANR